MASGTSILPAVVTIQDLPTGTTVTGAELIEAVQTVGGVAQSVQLTLSQAISTVTGALPSGGGTGQLLQSLGTSFAASWVNLSSLLTATSGLSLAGSTAITLGLASTAGLSVLGVGGAATAVPGAIAGTADQVLVVNHAGTAVAFGPVNLATSAAVTGVLSTANMTAINLATTGGGGITGQPIFQPTTALPAAGSTAVGIQISSGVLGIYVGTGTPTFSAAHGSIYLNAGGSNATSRLFVNTNGTTGWTAILASG